MEKYQEYRNHLAKEIKRCRFNKQKIRLVRILDEELNSNEYKDAKKRHLDSKTNNTINDSGEQVNSLLSIKKTIPQSIGKYNREDFPFNYESDDDWAEFVKDYKRDESGEGFFNIGLIVRRKEKKANFQINHSKKRKKIQQRLKNTEIKKQQ